MGFLLSGLFWGIILIIIGFTIIIRVLFHIDIPIVKVIFAFILIYWGLKLLFGGFGIKSGAKNIILFEDAKVHAVKTNREYSIIFGSGDIDLQDMDITEKSIYSQVNIVFGSGKILLNKDIPTIIKLNTVFGGTKLPNGNAGFFGDYVYRSDNFREDQNCLTLEINTVFGSARIMRK